MMDSAQVRSLLEQKALRSGVEHRVAYHEETERVIKDLDAHAPATQTLFDYVTDIELSNYFFGDDIQIEGFYLYQDRIHIVTSQSFVKGIHPNRELLQKLLEIQGLEFESYASYIIHDHQAGEISIIDLHENNVILDENGFAHPIDAHFYFDGQADRVAALEQLGIRSK